MKKILIYPILAAGLLTGLTACTHEANDEPAVADYSMRFRAYLCGMSAVDSRAGTGPYDVQGKYPTTNALYLTAYLKDNADERQYYFVDKSLTYDEGHDLWTLPGWYWPLQGQMSLMSYWCPEFGGEPSFDEISDVDGRKMGRMTVTATGLDGYTDFMYLSKVVNCPPNGTEELTFLHGLAWITVRTTVDVRDDDDTFNKTKSQTLQQRIKIYKVVIEDCARKGIATIMAGEDGEGKITWKTYDDTQSYVRDQVYWKKDTSKKDKEQIWEEYTDAKDCDVDKDVNCITPPVFSSYVTLGQNCLLILPQNKTAITVYYSVKDRDNKLVDKVERYELRDNSLTWEPGIHYTYIIRFRNYEDYDIKFDVLETWEGISIEDGNLNWENPWGSLYSENDNGSAQQPPVIVEPLHDGGSASGDDMDYTDGGRVF